MRIFRCLSGPALITVTLLSSGCAGITPQSGWRAAVDAARETGTWGPLAAAAVLSLGDMDENLSDWAAHETPLFGSIDDAKTASDDLRRVAAGAMIVSTLFATDNASGNGWYYQKGTRLLVEGAGVGLAGGTTNVLKDWTNRTRPNEKDDKSLPSAHASESFAYARFTYTNIDNLDVRPRTRTLLKVGTVAISAGTAWARVEAERHYSTDVLVGAALGNFVAGFTERLLEPLVPSGTVVSARLVNDGIILGMGMPLD